MSSMLGCSNGTVVIATAMVFSSTALFLAFARQFHGNQTSKTPRTVVLRSCLSSGTISFSRADKFRTHFPGNTSLFHGMQRKRRNRGGRRKRKCASTRMWKIPRGTGKSTGGRNSAEEPYRWLNRERPIRFVESPPCQRTAWLCTMRFSETEITELNALIDFSSWPNNSLDFGL